LLQGKHGEHSPGAAFVPAVGVIAPGIRCSAFTAIFDRADSFGGKVAAQIIRKIHLVMGWAYARADLCKDIGRITSKAQLHGAQSSRRNPGKSSFFSGMCQPDHAFHRVEKVHCGTIRNVNPEGEVGAIRDKRIHPANRKSWQGFPIGQNGNLGAVDLLARCERKAAKSVSFQEAHLVRQEAFDGCFAIHNGIDAGYSGDESMKDSGLPFQKREGHPRGQWFCAHKIVFWVGRERGVKTPCEIQKPLGATCGNREFPGLRRLRGLAPNRKIDKIPHPVRIFFCCRLLIFLPFGGKITPQTHISQQLIFHILPFPFVILIGAAYSLPPL